jgi:hypothetical protein
VGDAGAGHRDDVALTVISSNELQDVFGGAKEQYNARGITDTRADDPALALAHQPPRDRRGALAVPDRGRHEVGEETSTYVIRREPDGRLAIRASVMHGEADTH